jgi:glycosyltransferase involved in cell wall biosynthesis
VHVVYNPVVAPDLRSQSEEPTGDPWFDEQIPVLLAAGRLVHAKGFDLLLEAVARVRRQAPCRLIILGDGPLRGDLSARCKDLGIADAVKLLGFVANPFAFMRRCSAFVLPSRFEGLPGVLIQAMACGAAVVAADCPFGPSEIVISGESGILVPPEDPGALAEALLALLRNNASRQALAKAARASAQRYTLDAIMPNYVRALEPDKE